MKPGSERTTTVHQLVERYGSPLYLYELDDVDRAAAQLHRSLPAPSALYYSLKANPHPVLAEALRTAGCRAEVSSPGELTAALAAGFAPGDCLYTGPGKASWEIAVALAQGVHRFSVESSADYRKVARAAAAQDTTAHCLIRVNSPRLHGASGLRMTGVASPFGTDADLLIATAGQFAPRLGARVIGTHFFPLSNGSDEETVTAEITASIVQAVRLRDRAGLELQEVDLGGGFAMPYAVPGTRPLYPRLRHRVEAALDAQLPGWRAGNPEVAFESGRYLVGGSGRLVCTVKDVKRSHDRTFVVLDSGIHHLGGMSGLGRLLPMSARVTPVPRGPGPAEETPMDRVTVVGPLCTPADQFSRDLPLGTPEPGDVVEIPNVGAYGPTASLLAFLSRPVAGELILRTGNPVHASRLELRRTLLDDDDQESLPPSSPRSESDGV
ncbi:type III PLP-dependent enzyme [Streptomyces sp. CAU 1734]|uniref:type III PLP-dependent enzyme n=1 Tax=Streptomyces sp. CAU 1734 TaxID=3140360 RepID=UPI003260B97B